MADLAERDYTMEEIMADASAVAQPPAAGAQPPTADALASLASLQPSTMNTVDDILADAIDDMQSWDGSCAHSDYDNTSQLTQVLSAIDTVIDQIQGLTTRIATLEKGVAQIAAALVVNRLA